MNHRTFLAFTLLPTFPLHPFSPPHSPILNHVCEVRLNQTSEMGRKMDVMCGPAKQFKEISDEEREREWIETLNWRGTLDSNRSFFLPSLS